MSFQRFSTALNAKLLRLGIFTSVSVLASSICLAQNKHASPYPQRIITVAPHLSEVVESAGGANRLISVSAYSNFPDSVKQLPITSDARSIDLEKMKQLRPDLIIYWRCYLCQLNKLCTKQAHTLLPSTHHHSSTAFKRSS